VTKQIKAEGAAILPGLLSTSGACACKGNAEPIDRYLPIIYARIGFTQTNSIFSYILCGKQTRRQRKKEQIIGELLSTLFENAKKSASRRQLSLNLYLPGRANPGRRALEGIKAFQGRIN
jgi:hypothetical protein